MFTRTGSPYARHRSSLDAAAAIATIVALIIAVVALVVAYVEYQHSKEGARIAATLNYVARYKSDPVLGSVRDFSSALVTPAAKAILANPRSAAEWARKTNSFDETRNLVGKVRLVADFFDEFYICLSRNLCDLNLALTLVGSDVRTFYVWNADMLDKLKTSGVYTGEIGCGVAALFDAAKPRLLAQDSEKEIPLTQLNLKACPQLSPG
jgi:hypothetical protein